MNTVDIKHIKSITNDSLLIDEPMNRHTTFGIGGKAACYLMPKNIKELKKTIKYANEKNINTFFAGSGSNLLVSDEGYDGIIISLKKTFKKLKILVDGTIIAQSGVMLGKMVREATKQKITGLESLIGVPGTVGGALYMNAGAYNHEISNYFHSAILLDKFGFEKKYTKDSVNFAYRSSSLPENEILVEATFKYPKGNLNIIVKEKNEASAKRKSTQPLKYRSAGSIFKNPNNKLPAGYLIDQTGLKGLTIGNAEISKKHANFIINKGNAQSNDIIELIQIIKHEVMKKFNIKLELEIKLLGFKNV